MKTSKELFLNQDTVLRKGNKESRANQEIQSALGLDWLDGKYGGGTEKAVMAFQKKNGISITGEIDYDTFSLLLNEEKEVFLINRSSLLEFTGSQTRTDSILSTINEVFTKWNINTNIDRLCCFMAQVSHESGSFRYTEENLNYSADALMRVFGKYFTKELAEQYARNPQSIANRVYGDRMGNGKENSGEGWKYRGRGFIQLTGKDNYSNFSSFTGLDLVEEPELVSNRYDLAFESACWFWGNLGLNRFADKGDLASLTKKINGGTNGMDDRIEKFLKAQKLFGNLLSTKVTALV